MEDDDRLKCRMIKGILLCLTNLDYFKEHFNGELMQILYTDCHDSDKLILTCSIIEIFNGLKDSSTLDLNLELFIQRYVLIFKHSLEEQNKSNFCIDFISNLIEQLHKEQNFEANCNYILEESPFSEQTKKDFMFGKFLDFFEQTETSGISKLFSSTNIIIKECQICHSITYKYEIQKKILDFDIDEVISFKKAQNNDDNINKISLNDCFNYYYYSKKQNNDLNCNNQNCNGKSHNITKLISWTSDIMIITLKRKSFQNEEKDIEIKTTIDMNNYIDKDALNNLTKFNNNKMSSIYDLKCIFYIYENDFIFCWKTKKNFWLFSFDGVEVIKCDDILDSIDKMKHF